SDRRGGDPAVFRGCGERRPAGRSVGLMAGAAGDLAYLLVGALRGGVVSDAAVPPPVGAERATELPAAHAAARADGGGRNRAVWRPAAAAQSRAVAGPGGGGLVRRPEYRARAAADHSRPRILLLVLRALSRPACHPAQLDHAVLYAG